jgi:cytochrome c553
MIGILRKWSRPGNGFRVIVVLLLLSSPGVSSPGVSTSRISSPEASADGLSAKAELCTTCHGDTGLPARADIPIIWGQEFYYLYVQLKDYKAGRRHHAEMSGVVAALSKQEMRDLAQYFASKPWPSTGFAATPADISRGETASAAGVCVQCHLGGYEGNSRVPRLAGQQVDYLERTMMEFKEKTRMNSPAKASLMESFENDDIATMARYLAGY